jgi:hypothetical protein
MKQDIHPDTALKSKGFKPTGSHSRVIEQALARPRRRPIIGAEVLLELEPYRYSCPGQKYKGRLCFMFQQFPPDPYKPYMTLGIRAIV